LEWWQEWLGHPDPDDPYWQRLDWSKAVGFAGVPVAMVTSWHDLFVPWQLADWTALPQDGTARRLVIGPWVHEGPSLLKLYLGEALAWLDAHLPGVPGGPRGGPVRYYVTGAEEWRDADAWPLPGTAERRWYLHAGGALTTAEPVTGGPSCYRYDPADPTRPSAAPQLAATHAYDRTRSRRARMCLRSPPRR
jgi:uncharacterized protein